MRVLGIDPGTGRCGFGIVEKHGNRIVPINYGVIETFKEQNSLERLNIVYEGVAELIEMYRPHFMGVESLYFNTNITTGIEVAQARRGNSSCRIQTKRTCSECDSATG